MEKFDKYISALPKAKLGSKADRKIRFRLYRLILMSRLEVFFSSFSLGSMSLGKGFAIALSMIVVFFSATSIYAYASSGVVPGNILYPVKLALEKVEKKISVGPDAKIATDEKLATRRLKEALILSGQTPSLSTSSNKIVNEDIKNNINAELDSHAAVVNSIKYISDTVNATTSEKAIYKARENDKRELNYLNKIAENAKTSNNGEIMQKVSEAQKIISEQKYPDHIFENSNSSSTQETNKKDTPYMNVPDRNSDNNFNQSEPVQSLPVKSEVRSKSDGERSNNQTDTNQPDTRREVNRNSNDSNKSYSSNDSNKSD